MKMVRFTIFFFFIEVTVLLNLIAPGCILPTDVTRGKRTDDEVDILTFLTP